MAQIPSIMLNDGVSIPQLGLGTWQVSNDKAEQLVRSAFDMGYRHIDTAAGYENEEGVGAAVRNSGLPREEIFVTSKLRNSNHGYDEALKAFDATMDRLGLDVLDLYLIHWPMPHKDKYVETFKAFIKLKEDGRIRSIGVSNFTIEYLTRVIDETGVVPSVNQIELHPEFQQHELRAFHDKHGIKTESWSPLGAGRLIDHPVLKAIGEKHGKSGVQAMLRWHVQQGLIVFPKSSNAERMRQNIEIFDFELDADDMAKIAALDDANGRGGADPVTARFD
jgi:2,5-diketo-D-gluconate reductase A